MSDEIVLSVNLTKRNFDISYFSLGVTCFHWKVKKNLYLFRFSSKILVIFYLILFRDIQSEEKIQDDIAQIIHHVLEMKKNAWEKMVVNFLLIFSHGI